MTKEAVIYSFFLGFGIPAYEENTVPSDASFPYLTYSLPVGDILGGTIAGSCSLWYRGEYWLDVNEKSREISEKIGLGGVTLKCDEGLIWIRRGVPFSQNMGDDSDDMIRRKYINIEADFITA